MKLRKFNARKLNGHLDMVDLCINASTTFITGINGCGKTSALRAIVALIEPDIDWLSYNRFNSLQLDLEVEEKQISIRAEKTEPNGFTFQYIVNGTSIEDYISHNEVRNLKKVTSNTTFDDEGDQVSLTERFSELPDRYPALQFASKLQKPIFLGLDRTTVTRSSNRFYNRRIRRRSHVTIRAFLDESVTEAESLAVDARRIAEYHRSVRAEGLRTDLLLALFKIESNRANFQGLPKANEIKRLEGLRRSLKNAFRYIANDSEKLSDNVDTFFTELINLATDLQGLKIQKLHENHPKFHQAIKWLGATPKLSTINDVEELVNSFNDYEGRIFENTNRYIDVLNSFFSDSGKRITFGSSGEICIKLPSGEIGDVYCLSSGERQLFVLITVLMFNTENSSSHVLIIDEPELSLHLKWQENFVDSLIRANSQAQLIMATHSPSIILGRDDLCVAL